MSVTASFRIALLTILSRSMISSHNYTTIMSICHLMHTPLLLEGRGKTGYRTLQRRKPQKQRE